MPPKLKQKPKDSSLTVKQLQHVINIVKEYWPDYPISTENILQPTREFVLDFYERCAENLEKKLSILNRYHVVPQYPPNFEPEQVLFVKLSKIPVLKSSDFRLGDLYAFDPKRLKYHILVIMHFLMTAENGMDQAARVCQEVFESHHLLQTSKEKIEEQKELREQAWIKLTLAKKENLKLKEAAKPINAKYEKTLQSIGETDKKCAGLVTEVERFKSQIENLEEEVQKYEKIESDLKAKVVTQAEYDHLKTILDCLAKDVKELEENCDANGLYELRTNFEYLGKCLQELHHLGLPNELLKLSSLRDQLKTEQNDVTYALTMNHSSKAEIKQLQNELEKRKQKFTQENKTLQNELQILTDNGVLKEKELNMMFQEEEGNYKHQINQLQDGLTKLNDDLMRLRQGIINNVKVYLDMKDKLLNILKNNCYAIF